MIEHHRVWVEQEQVFAPRPRRGRIVAAGEAEIVAARVMLVAIALSMASTMAV